MGKLKKSDIIDRLDQMGIEHSGDMSYNDLYDMYKKYVLNASYSYDSGKDDNMLKDMSSSPLSVLNENVDMNPTRVKSVYYIAFL